ncbi:MULTISPECIES: hypothetical protein [Mesorhizobium]|nr:MULTISPECIES: hypothetical protein [Mesorhizobium]QIA22171.1 hypothetical protein A9K68_010540 [Mesorhizobium sp. AA22]
MFSDAQISLDPMTGEFVGVVNISTLPVGTPEGHVTTDLTVSANSPAPR